MMIIINSVVIHVIIPIIISIIINVTSIFIIKEVTNIIYSNGRNLKIIALLVIMTKTIMMSLSMG